MALLVSGTALASERPLAPIDREFRIYAPYGHMQQYHLAVADSLLGRGTRRTLEAVVIPSFEREWAIFVEPSSDGGGPQVVHTILQEQLWGRMEMGAQRPDGSIWPEDELRELKKASKKTWRYSAPLSATTATALERLWSVMLVRTQEPTEAFRCIDGTSYYLFQWTPQAGSRGGWGRCAQPATKARAVLDILERLRKCAGGSGAALMREDMALAVAVHRLLRQMDDVR